MNLRKYTVIRFLIYGPFNTEYISLIYLIYILYNGMRNYYFPVNLIGSHLSVTLLLFLHFK